MDGSVPGFVPRLLSDPTVGLFRADERVFDAMLDGWRAQMLARGLTTSTIENRCGLVGRFQQFTGEFPWQWRPADIEDFLAERRSGEKPISLTTLRSDSNSVAMFCSYLTHPAYGWTEFCERTFGDIPSQICFDWNRPKHTTDDAVPVGRRAFTKRELQRFFDYLDDLVDREHAAGSKRWLPVYRDSIAFKLCYAYGLRRRELTMLDLHDFGPNPHVPEYSMFGAVTIRWAKGTAGSGPRRRTVLTVPEFDWVVPMLQTWTSPGRRDRFTTADRSAALWPSERRDRVTFGDSFAAARDAVGLPKDLGLHCLRHSYVTHLIEAGYDPTFVQAQVGHSYASTTSLYTSVSSDFKQKAVQQMIARRIATPEEATDG
ncbi:site-specific recombinase XerD [Kribbella sp. VKM Ac-2571]|uniref:tyrosine-type recombinase/integrase n=1 Tax=Kribbella sp. VKM Ac-2571 TaxID=2512222 RepID=UPI00105E826B|nr:tyrosine-type recombinase/integrase [Kribbella sp. VKM Ac-2571]TDO46085.1 site-specific recombinase XerD [Kribbella sp. VKM Ac-2571]